MSRSRLFALLFLSVLPFVASCSDGRGGNSPSVVAVFLAATEDTLVVKATRSLQVVALGEEGDTLTGRSFTWTSLDTAVASVGPTGAVTARKLGTALVTVSTGERADTTLVRAVPAITVGPASGRSIVVADTLALTVAFTDATGAPLVVPGTTTWSVVGSGLVTVDAGGVVIGVAPGVAQVRAVAGGGIGNATVRVFSGVALVNRELSFLVERARPAGGSSTALYMMTEPAGSLALVSDSNDHVFAHDWSPSGSEVVLYMLNANGIGRSGTWVRAATGGPLTQASGSGNRPVWMPDGQRVVFAEHDLAGSNVDIWSANTTGGARQQLSTGGGVEHYPAPSPDGEWVAYRSGGNGVTQRLWLVRPNGTGTREVVLPFEVEEFEWSPDGRYLALNGRKVNDYHGAWVIRVDGTGLRSLTPDCADAGTCTAVTIHGPPTWHPDGRHLIYLRTPPSGWEWRIVRRDGSFEQSFAGGCGGKAQFSPNGQRIAMMDSVGGLGPGFCGPVVTDAIGGGRQVLASDTIIKINQAGSLAWRP
jgi:hypothetical protein